MIGVGEYAAALVLLTASAVSLLSKIWHEYVIGRSVFTFLLICGYVLTVAITWDAKGSSDWSHLPHAWHNLVAGRENRSLIVPHFIHEIRFLHDYPYQEGFRVEGIPWRPDMREYILIITNERRAAEVSNFKERLYLPFPVMRIEVLSHLGCEDVSVLIGEEGTDGHPPKGIVIDKNKIVATFETGSNNVSIAATKILPDGKIIIKMLASILGVNNNNIPGVMMYEGTFQKLSGQPTHYGRRARFITADEKGQVSIGTEFHKKGHLFPVPISGTALVGGSRTQEMPLEIPTDIYDRYDDD